MYPPSWMRFLMGLFGPLLCVLVTASAQDPYMPESVARGYTTAEDSNEQLYAPTYSPTAPAVWLNGTIGTEQQNPVPPAQGVTSIPAYSSLDTTATVNYDEPSSVLDDVSEEIYEQSQRLGLSQTVSEAGREELLESPPKPWLAWKSSSISATWIPGSGDDFGMTDVNLRATIKSPRIPFVSVTPNYQMTFLDGPDTTDIPGTLHRASVSFMGMMPLSERFMGQVMVSPGIASDYENTSSEAIRIVGMGTVIFMQSPQLQWVFGVVYLDRDDLPLLPAVGLTWSPDERTKYEFSFPRPRYLRQISKDGEREQWWYLAAELGGGSWAIERSSGQNDVVTLRDYRLLTGMEYKYPENHSWYWEAGLVIGRDVEYDSGIGDYQQDPSIVLRCGITF